MEYRTLDGMEYSMRAATACSMAISLSLMAAATWGQDNTTFSERLGTVARRAKPGTCPGNPDYLGVARVVEWHHWRTGFRI
jgi:hypothetical protein